MTTVGERATAVAWWERDDAPDLFEALTAAIETDEWGGHNLCSLTACRAPLHPGPCKGWKHTLHLVSPGAFHALERTRVDRLNQRRMAKIAQLKAQGKKIPPALLKEIQPRAHPGTPPPGWTPGNLAPGQPAANARANVDRIANQVGQKAAVAKGAAHKASQAGTAHIRAGQAGPNVPAPRTAPDTTPAKPAAPSAPAPAAPGKVVHAVATTTTPHYNAAQRVAANLARYRGAVTPGQLTQLEGLTDADYRGLDNAHKVDLHGRLRSTVGTDRARAHALADKFDHLDGKGGKLTPAAAPAQHPAAPGAPAVPAQRTSLPAQRAAKAATSGTAKAKLAAYSGLSKGDYDSLPDATKTKIARDLTLMHAKFLDPKKQADVAAVQAKLGSDAHLHPAATPSKPAAPAAPATDDTAGLTDFQKKLADAYTDPADRARAIKIMRDKNAEKATVAREDMSRIQPIIDTPRPQAGETMDEQKTKLEALAKHLTHGSVNAVSFPRKDGSGLRLDASLYSGKDHAARRVLNFDGETGQFQLTNSSEVVPDEVVPWYLAEYEKRGYRSQPSPQDVLRVARERHDAAPATPKPDAAAEAATKVRDAVNAVNAKGYPAKAKEAAQQAHGGNDLDHLNAVGELTRAELGKIDDTDRAQITKRLVEAEKSTDPLVSDAAKALHEAVTTMHPNESTSATLADLAEARIKTAEALGQKDDRKFLAAANELTHNHLNAVDLKQRQEVQTRLSGIAADFSLDRPTRELAHGLYIATSKQLPTGATEKHTLGQIHNLSGQRSLKMVQDAIAQGVSSGDMKRRLDNALYHADGVGKANWLRQQMAQLAQDTSLPTNRRAALAYRALAHDSKIPSSVRLALDVAHDIPANQPTATALGYYLRAASNAPGVPAHVAPILEKAMNEFIATRLAAMPTPSKDANLDELLSGWDKYHLANRLDTDAKDAIRVAARSRIDAVLNGTAGITVDDQAAAITAQQLLGKVDGKADPTTPALRRFYDSIQAYAAVNGRNAQPIEAFPLARSLTPAEYQALPPLGRKLLDDYLGNAGQIQALFPTPRLGSTPRETTAAYEMARLHGSLPSYRHPYINRAVATARFDLGAHTPDEGLRDLQMLTHADYLALTAMDRQHVDKALETLANPPAAMQNPPDLRVRYEAQDHLDGLKGTTYSYDATRAISAADPSKSADLSLLSALTKVDKAEFDKLPAAHRAAIEEKLNRLNASGDPFAAKLVAKYHPGQTPLGVGSPGPGVTGLPAAPTTSSDPKVQAALDVIYGAHPQAHTAAHQLKTYGALTAGQFSQLNGPEQQQVLGDLSYIATTSKGVNKTKAQGFISRFTAAGTPAGQVGPQPIYPPAGSVTGQTRLATPATGVLVESKNPGQGGDGFITLSNGKRVWGKYGAAGVLLAHDGPDGKRRYLMVQRGAGISDPGKWHYPGGAIDSNESAYQGGTREVLEELGFDKADFAAAKVHGYHESAQPGWKYTSIAATVDKQLVPNLKSASHGGETADAKWLTIEEIRDLDKNGRLLAPLAGGAFEQNVASILPPQGGVKIGQVAPVTKKLPRLTPSAGTGKDVRKTAGKTLRGKDLLAADPTGKHAALRAQVNANKGKYAGKVADDRLSALAAIQGFDQLPTVMSKADIDRLAATGDYWVVYRGVKDGGGKTAKQINDDLRYGDAYYGKGIFGNGYYWSTVERTARQYAASGWSGTGGNIVRALIPKDIKHAEGSKKVTEAKGYYGTSRVLQDAGRLGVAQGLDALILSDSQASHLGASKTTPSFNVLNRAIMIVQAEEHK